jgi:hypothetical protein
VAKGAMSMTVEATIELFQKCIAFS